MECKNTPAELRQIDDILPSARKKTDAEKASEAKVRPSVTYIFPKVDQIGPKLEKLWTFSDQIQYVLLVGKDIVPKNKTSLTDIEVDKNYIPL